MTGFLTAFFAAVLAACPGAELPGVEYRDGAVGEVTETNGVLRVEKRNALGTIVVRRAVVKAKRGSILQCSADVRTLTPVNPGAAKAFLRVYSGRENLAWQRKPCGAKATESPYFDYLVNRPVRQFARCEVGESGEAVPVVVFSGEPAVAEWSGFRVEDAKAADAEWHRRTDLSRRPPDRSATMMDEREFDALLAKDVEHVAALGEAGGGTVLLVDGRPVPPVLYKPIPFGTGVPFTGEGRVFEEAGVDLQVCNVRFGVGGGRLGFWSKDGFDAAGAVRRVKDFMRSAPRSLFLLTIRCDAYPEYALEHPDEIWRRLDGTPVYGTCSQGEKTPSAAAPKGRWPWVSNHSRVWREDVKARMTEFVAALKAAGLAKRVIGVHIAGYHDGQFAVPVADFSKSALAAFADWQRERFGEVRWTGLPDFGRGEFLDPAANPHAAEYQRFAKHAPMRMQEDFARHLKKLFAKPIVCGRWCMNPYGGSIMATLDFEPFVNSSALDFLVAQPAYHRRAPGLNLGVRVPLESFRRHRKLFLNEFDLRTWHGRSGENEPRGIFLSEARDPGEWRSIHRKLAGQMIANGMGWWYFDMADNWFDEPAIMKEIADVRGELDAVPGRSVAEAAFVIDEEGVLLRNRIGNVLPMREVNGTHEQLQTLAASGVPFDVVLVGDVLRGTVDPSRYRALVLAGFYRIDSPRRGMIAKALAAGTGVIALADSGAVEGRDALEGCLKIAEPGGLSAEAFHDFCVKAGAYVPAAYGLQVDVNDAFASVHCLKSGHYDFRTPKGWKRTVVPLDLEGGDSIWLKRKGGE